MGRLLFYPACNLHFPEQNSEKHIDWSVIILSPENIMVAGRSIIWASLEI